MAHPRNQLPARLRRAGRREAPARRSLEPRVRKGVLLISAVLIFFGFLWFFWENEVRPAYPIRYVRIEGSLVNLDEGQFTGAIRPLVRAGWFHLDLAAIEGVARSFAWVDSVRVTRQWPDTVVVRLREHHPIARWNENGLLSDRGMRFSPPSLEGFPDLPRLYGNEGQQHAMIEVWRKLNELFRHRDWRVTMLLSNSRQSWTARLSDGKELIIGRQDPVAAVERLLVLLPELGPRQIAAIKKVDLRYRNGFAVVWRFQPETEPEAGPQQRDVPKPEVRKHLPGPGDSLPQLAANQG